MSCDCTVQPWSAQVLTSISLDRWLRPWRRWSLTRFMRSGAIGWSCSWRPSPSLVCWFTRLLNLCEHNLRDEGRQKWWGDVAHSSSSSITGLGQFVPRPEVAVEIRNCRRGRARIATREAEPVVAFRRFFSWGPPGWQLLKRAELPGWRFHSTMSGWLAVLSCLG